MNIYCTKRLLLPSVLLLLLPTFLSAHGSHGSGIMAGFTHPIFGLDHLAAIIGLGVLSASYTKTKQWWPIAGFLVAMIIGGLIGIGMAAFSTAELIILASVFVFGGMLVINYRLGLPAFLVMAVFFGFFHGLAHGIEMPETTTVYIYILGFTLGATLVAFISLLSYQRLTGKYPRAHLVCGILILLIPLYLMLS